jgi:H+-transporting ATPase
MILGAGWYALRLSPDQMQTLTFVMLGFAGQGNVYVLRERGRLWHSRPAPVLLLASICDIVLMGSLAAAGFMMSALPLSIIAILIGTTLLFTLAMDSIKLAVFARLRID